jgi:hypothetical protein
MNKLKTLLIAGLVSAVSTAVLANSENFAGPYVGIQASAIGVELDSKYVEAASAESNTTTGTVGKTAVIAGAELGYALPLGESFILDIGATYVEGDAKLKYNTDDAGAGNSDVTFEVADQYTYYIAPTIVLSETSSVYFKAGSVDADVTIVGDVTKVTELTGEVYALGTRTQLANGIYIRSEAGIQEYDKLSVTGLGTTVETTTTVTADPTIAYGAISVGFKF